MKSLTVYSAMELKRIQQIELEALKVIIDVCKKLDIEYFLIGGSALGAVRHGGFIPWDDDIDVGMTRENYNRFLNEAPAILPEKYYLQNPYDDKNNPYGYSKLRVNGTKFVEYCNRNVDMHHGVYVDIFPFDEVLNDEKKARREFCVILALRMLMVYRQSPDISQEPQGARMVLKAVCRRLVHIILRIIPYTALLKRIDALMTRHNGSGQNAYMSYYMPTWGVGLINKSDLYPLRSCSFEDVEAMIPNNFDIYLRTHYGDYMQFPPVEERFGHKPWLVELD